MSTPSTIGIKNDNGTITDYQKYYDDELGHDGMGSVLFYTAVKYDLIKHYEKKYPDSGWDDGFAWIVPTTGMIINLDYGDPILPMNEWAIKLTDTVPENYHQCATHLEITGDDVDTALDIEAEDANKPIIELTVMECVHAMTELIDGLIEDGRKRRVEMLGMVQY